jgi:glycosyltransferase involved in cell wall biosynthesis
MTLPLIGVGVPVWRGAAFVAETLQSVLNQRDVRFRLIVSIDGADTESERACQPFASDPRMHIVVQPQRLGWVKNTAAVLAIALEGGAEFVCVQPHDDWIEADYLSTLLDTARNCTQAAVVFSDLVTFGDIRGAVGQICQDSVTGTPMERQLSLLTRHYNAVAYRGLIRGSALAGLPSISGNDCSDFACDTIWMARLARAGDLIRVPRVLYHKRYHASSAHAAWAPWPMEQKVAARIRHCVDLLAEALTVATDEKDRQLLIEAARSRLVLSDLNVGPYVAEIRAMPPLLKLRMQEAFEAEVAAKLYVSAGKDSGIRLASSVATMTFIASPNSLDFGNQPPSRTSAPMLITVTNTGNVPLLITSITLSGTNPHQFSQTHTCGPSVAVGATCTISVVFKPTGKGSKTATLSVSAVGAGTQTVALSGTGVPYTVSPTSLEFGNQLRGTASGPQSVTVTNTGAVALPITNIRLSGTNPGQFSQTHTCGTSVPVGATCTISVVFKPTVRRSLKATLNVNAGGGPGTHTVALSGAGT